MIGTVKWFDKEKGYGFIEPADGGANVFVHSVIVKESEDFRVPLLSGQRVEFDLVVDFKDRPMAANLRRPLGNHLDSERPHAASASASAHQAG
jgi:cold shock protein